MKTKKIIICLLYALIAISTSLNFLYAQDKSEWKHFKIIVNDANSNPLFKEIINYKGSGLVETDWLNAEGKCSYQIVVNILHPESERYKSWQLFIGMPGIENLEKSSTAIPYRWTDWSQRIRDGLLNYQGESKTKLE